MHRVGELRRPTGVQPLASMSPTSPETPVALAADSPIRSTSGESLDALQLATLGVALGDALDPIAMLGAIEARLRDSATEIRTTNVRTAAQQADSAERSRLELLEKAEEAAKKALNKAPPWVKKLVGAILTIAGTVASVVSGGASVALTVVGVMLLMAGEVVQALAERGVIDPKKGQWAAFALKIVGTILMAIASGGSNAGDLAQQGGQAAAQGAQVAVNTANTVGQVAAKAARVIGDVVDYVQATFQMVDGSVGIFRSVNEFRADSFNSDADAEELIAEQNRDRVDLETEEIVSAFERYQRVVRRVMAISDTQNQARLAAVQQLA